MEADGITAPLIFRTGSSAEKAARRLALACSRFDAGSIMEIETRNGQVYKFLCLSSRDDKKAHFVELSTLPPQVAGDTACAVSCPGADQPHIGPGLATTSA